MKDVVFRAKQNNSVTKSSLLMLFLPFCLEEVDRISKGTLCVVISNTLCGDLPAK